MQDLSRSLFPPGASRHDWAIDGGMALGMMSFTVLPFVIGIGMGMSDPLRDIAMLVGSTLMAVSVVARRHAPLLMMAGVIAGGIVMLIGSTGPLPALLAVPLTAYAVARRVPGRISRTVLYAGGVGSIAGPLQWVLFSGWFYPGSDWPSVSTYLLILAFLCFGAVVTPYAIGRRLHDSEAANAQARMAVWQRQQLEIAEREQRIRSAEVNARNQIARELHDIVAHSLSVMIVQAEGGRALARKHPEAAAESLDVIAETGREALQEMRRIVGVLRSGPEAEPAAFAPAPGLADLPELVRRTTDRATLDVRGQVPDLPPALGLTVYRIVQEALTNFLKHAGPQATARVLVMFTPGRVDLDVSDNGLGAAAGSDGRGHGLRGMAERVQAMGGRLLAEPHPEGGFRVRATLPYQMRQPSVRQNVPARRS
ncbi:sensor histidine kinase [Propionicicella superfundia]|uniref:sensor histidine kinase n=1 Tax=Propionicicella superfundia TaxID=348582 RepID=UPI0003F6D4C6|nr:sensor histidine kinase [Propionicicella superfundia]